MFSTSLVTSMVIFVAMRISDNKLNNVFLRHNFCRIFYYLRELDEHIVSDEYFSWEKNY